MRWLTQRYAIDWVKIDDAGAWWHGNAAINANYFGYGETVSSGAPGVVVSVLNDLPENTPPSSLPGLAFGTALGNHVIVDIGGDRFVTYAHLHMHVSDGASNATGISSGKPWVFTGFRLVGTLINEEQWLNQGVVVPAQIGPVAAPIDRQNQLPLFAHVVVFP